MNDETRALLGDLRAELPTVVAGGDDGDTLARLLDGRDPQTVTHAVVNDQAPGMMPHLAEALSGDWHTLLVVSDAHPMLAAIVRFVEAHDGVILLGGPSGPRPPAALLVSHA